MSTAPQARGGGSSRSAAALARIGLLLRRFVLARDAGNAALQSVVLQFVTLAANLVTGVITARLLGVEGRGLYAAAVSWPTMLGAFAVAGTAEALLMEIRRRPGSTPAATAWAGGATIVCASLAAALAYLFMPALLGPRQANALDIARLALLLTHVIATGTIYRYVFSGRGKFLLSNLATFLPHVIHACAIGLLALTGRLTVATAIAGLGLGVIGAQLVLLPLFLREVFQPRQAMRGAGWAVLTFALRAAPADVLAVGSEWSDRLLLILLLGPRDLGLYAVAYGFSRVVGAATPANGLLLSAMARSDRATAKQLHDLSVRVCIPVLGLAVTVACIASRPLIHLFYGSAFLPAVAIFKVLALQAAAARIGAVTAQLYMACNRPGLNSVFALANVVVSAALMIVLTPIYGGLGAAFALLTGTLVRLGLMWVGMTVHLRFAPARLWPSQADVEVARVMFRP